MRRSTLAIGGGLLLAACAVMSLPATPSPAVPLAPTDRPTEPAAGFGRATGYVIDSDGPVADALVRVKATENKTLTNEQGWFQLTGLTAGTPVTITAWAEGYYVGWVEEVTISDSPLEIYLRPYFTYDNHEYDWFSAEGESGSLSCAHCMPCYEEWLEDAHSRSAVNPRFLSMYNGTDLSGNQSPRTRLTASSDYGFIPLPPDPGEPYYGPGYKLDFPDSEGNCAACHVPAQAAHPGKAYASNPNVASGIELEGVFCEFCHKIGAVDLEPGSGLPKANMPGVLSLRLHRPMGDDQLFFGNFDDVTRRVSRLPLEEESAFCAPCHYGVFWDVVIYNSYGEWLESAYSEPESGKTCQDCHMPSVDYDYFVYPDKGGEIRDRSRIFSHRMPGASDQALLQDAVDMQVEVDRSSDRVSVEVRITNDNTGHKVPTDSPLRQMLLLVEAEGPSGVSLTMLEGDRIPSWGGEGGPAGEGYYAGQPGKGYALILMEKWTKISPTGAYWNPVEVVEDTRLEPFESDRSRYVFQADPTEGVLVRVRLIFRRAYKELMDQKGWEDPDIIMGEIETDLPAD